MNDLISRQAAIDATKRIPDLTVYAFCSFIDMLTNLPSVQPEIIRCKECAHADEYYHCDYMTTWNDGEGFCCYAERRKDNE